MKRLVVLLLLASILAESTAFPLFKSNAFDKLNNMLTEREKSDDLEANIKVAKKILDENPEEGKFLELTKQFVGLEEAYSGNRCHPDAWKLVSDAFDAIKKYVSDPFKDERRLSQMIVKLTKSCLYKKPLSS